MECTASFEHRKVFRLKAQGYRAEAYAQAGLPWERIKSAPTPPGLRPAATFGSRMEKGTTRFGVDVLIEYSQGSA